jgi:hypothetical protein
MQIFLKPLEVYCKVRQADVIAAKRLEASSLIKPEFVIELKLVSLWTMAV